MLRRGTRHTAAAVLLGGALLLAGCAAGIPVPSPSPRPVTARDTVCPEPPAPILDARGRMTLAATVDRMSGALLSSPSGTAWKPQAARAREIRDSRLRLSALVEDAEWVIVLSEELEGPRPAADKNRLRHLHERYAAYAPHDEIAARVNELLEDIREERLRRELKKLANRSWERARRGMAAAPAAGEDSVPAIPPPDPVAEPGSPERYCSDRRTDAARSFTAARATTDRAAREAHLRRSLALLDECLRQHPDTPEAEKARQNRVRVEQELSR